MIQRVLVTGSAGRLGRSAVAAIAARGHTVIGLDIRPSPGLQKAQMFVASLLEQDKLSAAIAGVDCLVHLGATPDDAVYPRPVPPGDADNFEDELVPNNIVGAYRVMEAARKAGVKKLVLASSGQVIVGHRKAGNIPVRAEASYAPRYLYACTKVFLEQLGQVYAAHHGMKVIAVRLGWCPRNQGQVAELTANPDDQDVYLSPADAGRFFACTVDAALDRLPSFAPVYVTSRPLARERYDLGPARDLVGYEPQDSWPTDAGEF
jgi:nucleoside-diphosphate-sugar epimerase